MPASLQPLSDELIVSALTAREFAHFVDDDGDVGGNWQGCLIYFFRLGKNNGIFDPDASNQELVSAITGADNNSVSRRASRRGAQREQSQETRP